MFGDDKYERDKTLYSESLGGLGLAYFLGVAPWIVGSFDVGN
jgi:hypothetical protein